MHSSRIHTAHSTPWVWTWNPLNFPLGVILETCKACWDQPPVNRITDTCKNITRTFLSRNCYFASLLRLQRVIRTEQQWPWRLLSWFQPVQQPCETNDWHQDKECVNKCEMFAKIKIFKDGRILLQWLVGQFTKRWDFQIETNIGKLIKNQNSSFPSILMFCSIWPFVG